MRRVTHNLSYKLLLAMVISLAVFLFAPKARAEKTITLSASAASVEVGKEIRIPVYINTDGDPINAVGFKIIFSTETLEGLMPDGDGSICNMSALTDATKVNCGIHNQTYSGNNGLVTTLRFKGRTKGQTTISIEPANSYFGTYHFAGYVNYENYNSNIVYDYSSNSLEISVTGEGEAPVETVTTPTEPAQKVTLVPPTLSQIIAPSNTNPVSQSDAQTLDSSTTFGSKAQVGGSKGSQPEEPLSASVAQVASSIKGIFSGSSLLWSSILPTIILIIIIAILGVKMYINEKKRHAYMDRLLNKQLGTLSALESKIEIIDQKGGEGREQYLKEIETAKADISQQTNPTSTGNPAGKVQSSA